MQSIIDFRKIMSKKYRLPQRIAFHATEIVNGHGEFHFTQRGLTTLQRFSLYRDILEFLANQKEIKIFNVFVNKRIIINKNIDVFNQAWEFFIQRFHNSLEKGGPLNLEDEFGLLITD